MKFDIFPKFNKKTENKLSKVERMDSIDFEGIKSNQRYREEIFPIIEILKPDEVSLVEYENQMIEELFTGAKKQQLAQGVLLENPEKTIDDVKIILNSQVKSLLEDTHDYKLIKKLDLENVKKAKIALLVQDDLTDFKKYSSRDPLSFKINDLRNYIIDHGEEHRFTESDIDVLMKTKYKKNLTSINNDHMYYIGHYGTLNTIPKSLMIGLIQAEEEDTTRNHYWAIKGGLESSEIEKYDDECLEQLIASGYVRLCLEHFDKFKGKPIEKILKSGDPYGDKNPFDFLKNLNLPKEDFDKYLDIVIKHNVCYGLRETFGNFFNKEGEVISLYQDSIKKLHNIEMDISLKNDTQNLIEIKDIIENGHVGLAIATTICKNYIKKYAENDYENFKKSINKYDQEHLVLDYLKDEDKVEYAQKLIEQGEEYKIVEFHKLFKENSLNFDVYNKIKSKNLVPSLKADLTQFGHLPEEEAIEFIETGRAKIFLENINTFNLQKEFLYNEKVQQACFEEFNKEIMKFDTGKARIISEKIPFPQDKLDEAVLKAVKTKWIDNKRNDWARWTIREFPSIKEFLNNPEDKKRATEDLKKELSSGYAEYVADILENFPLDKEVLDSQEIKDLCKELIQRSSKIKNENSKDFNEGVQKYFEIIERISKYIEVPEYLKQQKEIVDKIHNTGTSDFYFYKDKLIYKIIGSENPNEVYENYVKLADEIKDGGKIIFSASLIEKYLSKFEVNDNKEEKNRFISYIENMPDLVSHSGLFVDNFDYLYNNFSKLTGPELESHQILLKRFFPLMNVSLIKDMTFQSLFQKISSYNITQQNEFFEILKIYPVDLSIDFDNNNYTKNILSYINITEELGLFHTKDDMKNIILENFSGEYKDIALKNIIKDWQLFLSSDDKYLPPNLFIISKLVDDAGGAGNLKHFESIGNLMYQTDRAMDNPKTAEKTKIEIKSLLFNQEKIFEKEKWSQDDRSEFYNLSNDILNAAPSLYSAFAPVLEKMSPKETKEFIKEIFPFYQAELVIIQEMKDDDFSYDPKKLVIVRESLKDLAEKMSQNKEENRTIFNNEKIRLLNVIKDGFRERFGLMKTPKEFSKEDLRSIQNAIRYMGNMSHRSLEKEALISFYLGLELNGEWSTFRQGKEIKIEEYLSGKHLDIIKPLLEERIKNQESLSNILGVPMNKMPKFQELLQEDVISNIIGNIETVDIKLGNIKRNVLELTDPDIYEDKRDKDIISLLTKEGKFVGSMLAKTYAEVSGRSALMTKEEKELQNKVALIFDVRVWDTEKVKQIQDIISPFSLITSMINKIEEEKVDENIEELQKRLMPTNRIIDIFNRLGEDFKQESGAIALSKDLTYLESLIVKDSDKITKEEKIEVNMYLDKIREKMKELEIVFDKVREYFDKIKKSSHLENNTLLKNRLTDIEKIIYSKDSSTMIISHMTKDLNLIIENMRQCLGCMRKEINNDTNLAFGEYNKFFMVNQSGKEKGSISDEIVFLVPIKKPNNKEEMSFVLDRVYGSKSSDVLVGNVFSVYKKYQNIKKEFPNANISISVSEEAMSSVGVGSDILKRRLVDTIKNIDKGELIENLKASFFKSKFSDNYVEFGDKGPRDLGDRTFSALVIN